MFLQSIKTGKQPYKNCQTAQILLSQKYYCCGNSQVASLRIMDQLKRNAIECLRFLHRDDVLYQSDHASSGGDVITKVSSPCESSSPAVLKKSVMPMKKRIFEADCDLPSTQKRMKNGHDSTMIPSTSYVGSKKNGGILTTISDSCSPSSVDQEKPLYGGEEHSIMRAQNQQTRKQENNHNVPKKKNLATDIELQDGKGTNEKNKREKVLSSPSPVVLQEHSYFKNGQVNCNKFPLKVRITSNFCSGGAGHTYPSLCQIKSSHVY